MGAGEGISALAGRRLRVRVEAALADVLVVSCGAQGRRYQGVLLDCSKRNLPFGVSSLHPAFTLSQKASDANDNKLFSVSQRFAYQDPDYKTRAPAKAKQPQQRAKMTVRLRPRKVLCSKCKGICNENSENVAQPKRRRNADTPNGKERRSQVSNDSDEKDNGCNDRTLVMSNSLIPKLSRLQPNEITEALNGNVYRRNEIWIPQADEKCDSDDDKYLKKTKRAEDVDENFDKSDDNFVSSEKSSDNKILTDDYNSESEGHKRKIEGKGDCEGGSKRKRVEPSNSADDSSNNLFPNARTLKISYGEGEGTVLKLPVTIVDYDSSEKASSPSPKNETKAARRAMKKAKKQARRQATPEDKPSSPNNEEAFQRKHKHKVKHKKKRKDDKKVKIVNDEVSESETPDENHSSIEEFNVKKLPLDLNESQEDSLERNDSLDEPKISDDSAGDWVNCEGSYGGIGTGDVVWGKLQGFPWWPGRIVTMGGEGLARVAWFASTTSSLVPHNRLAPFLDNFKIHFNKKKRGPYKEAVRQASLEAGGPLDPLATDPLAPSTGNALTPLSSPPIDVLS